MELFLRSIPQTSLLNSRWVARARAVLMKKDRVSVPKGMGFRGKRSMDMFEVTACSMGFVSVTQVSFTV